HNVVEDQHLSIALRSSADADGGRGDFARDHGCHLARHTFQHHRKHSGALERDCVFHEPFNTGEVFALNLVPAHLVQRLRGQADMSHDGHFGVKHAANQVHTLASSFNFYGFSAGLFYQTHGVAYACRRVTLVSAKRHVGNHHGGPDGPAYGASVVQHFIDGDRQRAVIAQHDLGQRIAHQNHVDAAFVHQAGGGVVVSSQAGNRLVP